MKKLFHARLVKWGALVTALLLVATTSHAVIFQSTDDPTFNTTAPTGALAQSGWELQGEWGSFLGTPIAPQYFIAARHVGGSVGAPFNFRGVTYTTVAVFDDANSDLRIWKVDGVFPDYARLYTANNELGRDMVVLGRGTRRGPLITSIVVCTNYVTNAVTLKSLGLTSRTAKQLYPNCRISGGYIYFVSATGLSTNTVLNGWAWGGSDGAMRWGKNPVKAVYETLLSGTFTLSADPNICHLSGGDSSGAIFIHDGTAWKLAGINYAVEGPFKSELNGGVYQAALFDKTGLYRESYYFPADGTVKPSCFYASRISTRVSWIQSIIGALP